MSIPLDSSDILFQQRLLRAEGLYRDKLDGVWGPHTERAQQAFDLAARRIEQDGGTFDPRSERHIHSLCLRAQREARAFLRRLLDDGLRARIISGTRTYAEQDRLYRQGRFGNPGPIVTNATSGHSNHNFGLAWDIGLFAADGGYLADGPEYDRAARVGLTAALEWGGNWHAIVDKPHYQLAVHIGLADLRQAFENGATGDLYLA